MSTQIRNDLNKMLGGKVKFEVHEVESPNLSAHLAVESIVGSITRRYPYKRAINGTIRRVMDSGAKGIKVFISGRLGGNKIARKEKFTEGSVPTSTLSADVQYAAGFAKTKKGKAKTPRPGWCNVHSPAAKQVRKITATLVGAMSLVPTNSIDNIGNPRKNNAIRVLTRRCFFR